MGVFKRVDRIDSYNLSGKMCTPFPSNNQNIIITVCYYSHYTLGDGNFFSTSKHIVIGRV